MRNPHAAQRVLLVECKIRLEGEYIMRARIAYLGAGVLLAALIGAACAQGAQPPSATPPLSSTEPPPAAQTPTAVTLAPAPQPQRTPLAGATPWSVATRPPLPVPALPETLALPNPTELTPMDPQSFAVPADDPLVQKAVTDLAGRLGITPEDVTVLSVEAVTWPDSSLGCPQPGMVYLQVMIDGLRIRLSAGGALYEYHSGGSRDPFLCPQARPQIISRPTGGPFPVEPPGGTNES